MVGGAIGAAVSDGDDRLIAVLAGATIGAVIGHEIGEEMDERDRACFGHSLELLEDGRRVVWDGGRSGLTYTLAPDGASSVTDGSAGPSRCCASPTAAR